MDNNIYFIADICLNCNSKSSLTVKWPKNATVLKGLVSRAADFPWTEAIPPWIAKSR